MRCLKTVKNSRLQSKTQIRLCLLYPLVANTILLILPMSANFAELFKIC